MERRLTAIAVVAVYLAAAPQAARSPDGLEMLAMAMDHAGQGPAVDGGFWPPLWPALLAPFALLGDLERSAWILNLTLAGAVTWPLHLTAERLGGVWAARAAAFFWSLVPFAWFDAAVLDARPLGWFLCAMATALAVDAHHRDRPWWPAFAFAALAPLARPEGLSLVPLLALGALVLGHAWKRVVPYALGALLPTMLDGALRSGGRGTWGAFWVPWSESWEMVDFLALYGIASAPTDFRAHVVAQLDAGLEEPPSALALLAGGPDLVYLAHGLAQCLGVLLLLATIVGALVLVLRSARPWRAGACVLLGLAPLVALAFTPMLRGQATPHTNLGFVAPVCVAVAFAGIAQLAPLFRRRQLVSALPVGLALLALLDVHYGPVVAEEPAFVEDSPAAYEMATILASEPGAVACTFSSRGVVRRANRPVVPLGSSWEPMPRVDRALFTSVDVQLGEDGGRALELLEDPRWEPVAVTAAEGFELIYLKRSSE